MRNEHKAYPLHQSPLFKLTTKKRLAALLELSVSEMQLLAKSANALYSEFDVPKNSGGLRGVENPRRQLKMVQARVARLLGRIAPPDYLFCPVKGRSYVMNAAQHLGQPVVHCLDIRKYFPNTSSRRIYWFFHSVMKCETDVAGILAKLATYQGHLPTGSPLSPIMAFFAHYDVWEIIAGYCKAHSYHLTVYIDDVTISGISVSPSVLWDIKRAIHRAGLRYHKEKHFIGRPSEITGVIVHGDRLLVPNRQLKKLRELQHDLRQPLPPAAESGLRERLAGLKGQISQIAAA
ncbi:reverse transcriptase family protein [Rhizobium rhizogenes]|uniref:reverse transcriptase family protein n=1 Tax=Rhizobium rhizogenes TaxID=359 RepID=UPI00226E129A|nr:reverse transcriptase family protein [Rhizobium rhizogenes]